VALEGADFVGVEFRRLSPDGEEGYPGNLDTTIRYRWTDRSELVIEYRAETDRSTLCNLTHHSYFNLAGHDAGPVLGHRIQLMAPWFTPVGPGCIPTGAVVPVAGTPLDFTEPREIGERLGADDEQLRLAGGYDHNFVLGKRPGELAVAARVEDPGSGRSLEVETNEPAIQFYGGNFLDGSITGKGGVTYGYRTGLCLEPQAFPDGPNRAHFPSTRLDPGQVYRSTTLYRFGVI
jgi:aldose 1-epimerase